MAETEIDWQARVLLRDANLLILNKPQGMPVHPGPSGQASVEDVLPQLTFGLNHVPKLAHRLDHDTSGCLIAARHPKALSRLGRLFSAGKIAKTYWALTRNAPDDDTGEIALNLLKVSDGRKWRIVPDARGQTAVTAFRVLQRGLNLNLIELRPQTGRTHQIRVHLAALGFPIIGDEAYGGETGHTFLHARRTEIPYWQDRESVIAEAPPPEVFEALIATFE